MRGLVNRPKYQIDLQAGKQKPPFALRDEDRTAATAIAGVEDRTAATAIAGVEDRTAATAIAGVVDNSGNLDTQQRQFPDEQRQFGRATAAIAIASKPSLTTVISEPSIEPGVSPEPWALWPNIRSRVAALNHTASIWLSFGSGDCRRHGDRPRSGRWCISPRAWRNLWRTWPNVSAAGGLR